MLKGSASTTGATDLDEVATRLYHPGPDNVARRGFAVAHQLDPDAPAVDGLPDDVRELVEIIANALRDAECPLVISGTSSGSDALLESASNAGRALHAINDKTQL